MELKTTALLVAVAICFVGGSAQGGLLLYEPFDYAPGSTLDGLTDADSSSDIGLTGAWTAAAHHTVEIDAADHGGTAGGWQGIPAGTMPNLGGFACGEDVNGNQGYRSIDPAVTATFIDGTVTWMSFVAANTANVNHHKPNLAIGQGELMDDRAQKANGQAIGGGPRYNDGNGDARAAYWDDETVPPDGIFEEHRSGSQSPDFATLHLQVYKFEWGATSDTVTVANFSLADAAAWANVTEANFNAIGVSITSAVNLDQLTFDTISFHGTRTHVDEIRIGTGFDECLPEPATMGLLAIGGLALIRRGRK